MFTYLTNNQWVNDQWVLPIYKAKFWDYSKNIFGDSELSRLKTKAKKKKKKKALECPQICPDFFV